MDQTQAWYDVLKLLDADLIEKVKLLFQSVTVEDCGDTIKITVEVKKKE